MPKKEKQKNKNKKNVSSLNVKKNESTQQKKNDFFPQELPFWIPFGSCWSQVLANDSNIKGRTPSSK